MNIVRDQKRLEKILPRKLKILHNLRMATGLHPSGYKIRKSGKIVVEFYYMEEYKDSGK